MRPDTSEHVGIADALDLDEVSRTTVDGEPDGGPGHEWDDELDFTAHAPAPLPVPPMVVRVGAAVVAVGLVALAVAVIAARRGGDDDGGLAGGAARAPVSGGRLLYGLAADPESLDPAKIRWDESGLQVASALYDPVTAFDGQGRPQPYLIESLAPSGDLLQWQFRLRPGVLFSNGDPLDAAAFTEFLHLTRKSPAAGSAGLGITDVRVIDDVTVRITTARPWATLPAFFAGQGGFVVSPRQVDAGTGVSIPAGTGPFLLRRWDRGKRLELARNPRYWRPKLPRLDAVELVVVPDGATRVEQVRRGGLDVAPLTTPGEQRTFDESNARQPDELRLGVERDGAGGAVAAIMFDTDRPPLDDRRVRRALAQATDLRALAASNGWPDDRGAQGPLAPGSPFFRAAAYPPFNLDQARTLVREYVADAKGGKGRAIVVTVHTSATDTRLLSQVIEQWTRAGIKASLVVDEPQELRRRGAHGELDAVWLDTVPTVDPDQLWPYLVPEPNRVAGTFTYATNGDPVISGAMADGRASFDAGGRREAYARVQAALAESLPALWILRREPRLALSARVRDARNTTLPDGSPALPFVGGAHRLTETWIAP